MEDRLNRLQRQLIDLGYKYTLKPESLLLVEKLVEDLIETTENLRKYMKIAKEAIEERDNLKFGAEPYKCDNAKLMKECNDLHMAFAQVKEGNDKHVRDLKKKLSHLEKEREESVTVQRKLREKVRQLELEAARKTRHPKTLASNPTAPAKTKSDTFKINSAMALADQQRANLVKEINRLKDQHLELTECNDDLRNKLANREKEINRLAGLLEGGRPVSALNKDCCYQDANSNRDEINCLQKEKMELEFKLKDARAKQHEAMKHALHLAERNNQLEKELKDIDQMALAVEEECNTTVKNNCHKVTRLQDKMHNALLQLHKAEKEAFELKRDKESLLADVEAIKIEKRHLQSVLLTALDDKKRLTDKINKFSIIERDLNLEIDRLVRDSATQKKVIAELKGRCLEEHYNFPVDDMSDDNIPVKQPKRKVTPKSPPKRKGDVSRKTSPTRKSVEAYSRHVDLFSYNSMVNCCSERSPNSDSLNNWLKDPETCLGKMKQMIDEELNKRYPQKSNSLERLRNERDFYIKEYQTLIEQFRRVFCEKLESNDNSDFCKKLREKEEQLECLRHENQILSKEKHNLMSRLEAVQDFSDNPDNLSLRSSLKRLERERDLLKADANRLEEERDSIRNQLRASKELQDSELERYKKLVSDSQAEIRRYELEKRDLVYTEGAKRSTIDGLEETCEGLKTKLKQAQEELTQLRTMYNQLKVLNEQTDRALADAQKQLMQAEKEVDGMKRNSSAADNNVSALNQEIALLKKDVAVLRQNLVEMDQEKDHLLIKLDEKTERIAVLEQDLGIKDGQIRTQAQSLSDFKNKISSTLEEKANKEYQLKSVSSEINDLKSELQTALRNKEAALQENRRLQEELAACIADCRNNKSELSVAKRHIEDMKMQLQHYVAEVKRIEDLMTYKEVERSEMLDQFRNLSHEATILETNNHSLESEATQSKMQLSVALDHAGDLERKIDEQNTLIRDYERQISELTSQIANLEMKLKHSINQQDRSEAEMKGMKDLCVRLDKQKDELVAQLQELEGNRSQTQREMSRFQRDTEMLRKSMEKDQDRVVNLEKLLEEHRQEVVDQRLLNEELQSEVLRLNKLMEKMHEKLIAIQSLTEEEANAYKQEQERMRNFSRQMSETIRPSKAYDLQNAPPKFSKYKAARGENVNVPNVDRNLSDIGQRNYSGFDGADSGLKFFEGRRRFSSISGSGMENLDSLPRMSALFDTEYSEIFDTGRPAISSVSQGRSYNFNPADDSRNYDTRNSLDLANISAYEKANLRIRPSEENNRFSRSFVRQSEAPSNIIDEFIVPNKTYATAEVPKAKEPRSFSENKENKPENSKHASIRFNREISESISPDRPSESYIQRRNNSVRNAGLESNFGGTSRPGSSTCSSPKRPCSPVYNVNLSFTKQTECTQCREKTECLQHPNFKCNANINVEDLSDVD